MTTTPNIFNKYPPTLFFIVITVLPLRKMAVTNSLKYYSFFPLLLFFFFCFILTENILNHVSLYTVHAQRNKSELIMRGPSLRKYKRQLWSRMACNSLPDPIPNLLIRCFFFLSLALLCSNLPAELTQMGTCCPIKDTFKAKHVIHFILQEEGMWGWECCLVRDEPRKLCLFSLCRWQLLRSLITAAQSVCLGPSCVTNENGRHSR